MPGTILKTDIITDEALNRMSELVNYFMQANEAAKTINATLSNSEFKNLPDAAKRSSDEIKKLYKNTQEFQSIVKLGAQQQKTIDAERKKAEKDREKEINRRAALSKQRSQEYIKEKRAEAAADKKAATDRRRLTQLIIKARQTEAGSLTRLNALNKVYQERMKGLNVLIPEQAKRYAMLNKQVLANNMAMSKMAMGAKQGGKQFNMLQWQITQVAREMPAFAYGVNVGIGALSNNLPMLFDEISRVRMANKALAAEGKATTSVLAQVGKSIFSWQTALVAVVTLFTLYSKEIFEWTSNLFKGSKVIDAVAIKQKALTEAMNEGSKSAIEESNKMDILYRAATDVSKSMEDRQAAVDELQKTYPDYLGNIDDEAILAGEAAAQYEKLRKVIIEKAYAQAYANEIQKNAIKIFELENKLTAAQQKQDEAAADVERTRVQTLGQRAEVLQAQQQAALKAERAYSQASTEVGNLVAEIAALSEANVELEGKIDISSWTEEFKSAGRAAKGLKDATEEALGGSFYANLFDYVDAYYTKRLSLARNDAQETIRIQQEMLLNELRTDDLTLTRRQEILAELRKLDDKYFDNRSDDAVAAIYEQADKERIARSKAYSQELTDAKNRADKRKTNEIKLGVELLQIEYRAQQAIIDNENTTLEAKETAVQEQKKLEEELQKYVREGAIETERIKRKQFQETLDVLSDVTNAGFELGAAINERTLQNTERRYEIEAAAAGDNVSRQLSAERKYEKEVAKIKKRQAIASKANAAFDVVVNTARAIMETLGQTGIFGIPLTPIIAGIGALQLATVLAQPIPQFAEGVENFGGGLAIVGDKKGSPTEAGGSELAILPGGKMALTPSTPTLVDLPAGTDIIPNDMVSSALAQKAMSSTTDIIDMSSTNNVLKDIRKNTSESVSSDGKYKYVTKKGFRGRYRL